MIKIQIGEDEKLREEASEQWINHQIARRRADGISVCVRVIIKERDLDMILSTPTCKNRVGGGRPPTPREDKVFDLWKKRGLDNPDFTGGNLIAFLKQFDNLF
jgi:hypothetical protein